ncbi:alpha/beta hydrolase [Phenylobacterium sp.]|uniref:alpha/beta fold hydrolase n=1 Tax=Phenylobacterium sp. TaxID=1871053 RepID=UPI002600BDE0|nr:alpha/beta hydrolase [Phenylobacterium sp.]
MAVAVVAALLSGCGDGGLARSSAAAADPGPARLVRLPDDRVINLRCSGHGAPTVLFEAGWGSGGAAWGKVAPTVSKTTRACAYDRAGYEYSDPGPLPRDGASIARDLDLALQAAGEKGPFILVGHSAGGLYARLFAARRPQEVKGLVLLDPTVERRSPQSLGDGLDGIRRRVTRCLEASQAQPKRPFEDPQWSGCVSARTSPHGLEIALRPDIWRNQLSELDEIFGRTSDQAIRLNDLLNYIPVYVITASDTAASAPKVGYGNPQSIWELQHQRLAFSFLHGWQRTVLSSHLMMNDRPEVVIDAVLAMVQAARANTPPEALAPSETTTTTDQPFGAAPPVTK